MTTPHKKLARALQQAREREAVNRKLWKSAERELARLETALDHAQKLVDKALNRLIKSQVAADEARKALHAACPAVVQSVVASKLKAVGDGLSVEKIARKLGYGNSGRTRTELSKTLEAGLSKVKAKLEDV